MHILLNLRFVAEIELTNTSVMTESYVTFSPILQIYLLESLY